MLSVPYKMMEGQRHLWYSSTHKVPDVMLQR